MVRIPAVTTPCEVAAFLSREYVPAGNGGQDCCNGRVCLLKDILVFRPTTCGRREAEIISFCLDVVGKYRGWWENGLSENSEVSQSRIAVHLRV